MYFLSIGSCDFFAAKKLNSDTIKSKQESSADDNKTTYHVMIQVISLIIAIVNAVIFANSSAFIISLLLSSFM